ncbi:MAG: peptide deformylase [Deltaproteobacteria bacterium]|nr:peptide deformylase [Deltaproteobacteria bacterium]
MAVLDIRKFPDPILREHAKRVTSFGADLKKLVADMADTMFDEPGIGLAATQVGESLHLFILDASIFDTSRQRGEPAEIAGGEKIRVFINAEVTLEEGDQTDMEGCLSFPGIFAEITRPKRVGMRALDIDGKPFEVVVDALPARALLHELDHLEGRLLIDYMSPLKRRFVKREADRGFPNAEKNRDARDSAQG